MRELPAQREAPGDGYEPPVVAELDTQQGPAVTSALAQSTTPTAAPRRL